MSDRVQPTANTSSDIDATALSASLWERNQESKLTPSYQPSSADLDSFRSGRWWQSNFSREDINSIANSPTSETPGRRLAQYVSKNFNDIQNLTSAGSEGSVHLSDIRLAVELGSIKQDVQSIVAAKEQLLSKFDKLDSNGDNALSKRELKNGISPGTDETLNEGLSALVERHGAFAHGSMFSSEVTRLDLFSLNRESAFDALARPEYLSRADDIETRPYRALGQIAGLAIACSPLYRGESFLMKVLAVNAGGYLGGMVAGTARADDIQHHYITSTSPAAKRLFGI